MKREKGIHDDITRGAYELYSDKSVIPCPATDHRA